MVIFHSYVSLEGNVPIFPAINLRFCRYQTQLPWFTTENLAQVARAAEGATKGGIWTGRT